MGPNKPDFVIVVADDDEDDCLLIHDALKDNGVGGDFRFVHDGAELMNSLSRCESRAGTPAVPCPDLILLDLNMPRLDGREALQQIKGNPRLKTIPVIVFTTSSDRRDVELCNNLGAASFITKPMDYSEWVEAMEVVRKHLPDAVG